MSATIRIYANGLSMGVAGKNPLPARRGEVKGWSAAAVRRHTRWLYSIDGPALVGEGELGYAFTLTLKHCPEDNDAWSRLRERWLQRVRVLGAVRWHWVVEWQRRGVPHIHAAVYFPAAGVVFPEYDGPPRRFDPQALVLAAWMSAAGRYDARLQAQHSAPIHGAVGWLKYLSKHAARGVRHYQRTGMPAGWTKTGRPWGHGGSWPEIPPVEVTGTMADFHRFRRLVRAWRLADARAAGDRDRVSFARRMLACPDRRLSAVRGVSDWVPEAVALRLWDLAGVDGGVESRPAPAGDGAAGAHDSAQPSKPRRAPVLPERAPGLAGHWALS